MGISKKIRDKVLRDIKIVNNKIRNRMRKRFTYFVMFKNGASVVIQSNKNLKEGDEVNSNPFAKNLLEVETNRIHKIISKENNHV